MVGSFTVVASSFEVHIGVQADLIDGLGLTGHTLQIHYGNVAVLYQHL